MGSTHLVCWLGSLDLDSVTMIDGHEIYISAETKKGTVKTQKITLQRLLEGSAYLLTRPMEVGGMNVEVQIKLDSYGKLNSIHLKRVL